MPLWQCAAAGRYEIAALLLERGADPNADVYAGGTPVMQAHRQGDQRMVALLEQYGGAVDAVTAGAYGLVDRARVLLAGPQEARRAPSLPSSPKAEQARLEAIVEREAIKILAQC
jgi:ankyrin repeat protein